MKIGDLVKHPAGIKNVCKEQYALGIVLYVRHMQNPEGETQVKVMWHGKQSHLVYNVERQLLHLDRGTPRHRNHCGRTPRRLRGSGESECLRSRMVPDATDILAH